MAKGCKESSRKTYIPGLFFVNFALLSCKDMATFLSGFFFFAKKILAHLNSGMAENLPHKVIRPNTFL